MKSLEDQVYHSLSEQIPEFTSTSITVALSMGCDSMALFHILYSLKLKFNFKLSACHLNHGIREESEIEQKEFVKLMVKYGIPYYTESLKIPYDLINSGKSFETWARNERYKFYKRSKEILNSKYIATAHIKEDVIETFYFNLFRGSGLSGVCSIPFKRGYIIRPLINISKKDLKNYLNKKSVFYFEDKTNMDSKINRNYIRNLILPLIDKRFPQSNDSILSFIDEVKNTLQFINSFIPIWYNQLIWSKENFSKLSDYLQNYIVYKKIKELSFEIKGDFSDIAISRKNIAEIVRKLNTIDKGYVARFSFFDIYLSYGNIYFSINKNYNQDRVELNIDEIIKDIKKEINYRNYKIYIEHIDNKEKIEQIIKSRKDKGNQNLVFYNNKLDKLIISGWKKGDKIKFSTGEKKLQDIFVDWKIPLPFREDIVVIRSEKDIIGFYIPYNFRNIYNFILSKDYYVDFNLNFSYILLTIEYSK